MGQKRTYKQYSKEYKEEAVALVREQGYSVPEAAKSLGIASNILYRWKDKIESQLEGKSLSVDEREELKRLRKENKNLRIEKEILKKQPTVGSGSISKRMTTDLICKAMIMAYNLRQPPFGLVFHSDRGSQYTSKRYRKLLEEYGIRASMGDVGACWDNAVVERFFGSIKHDWILKLLNQRISFKMTKTFLSGFKVVQGISDGL